MTEQTGAEGEKALSRILIVDDDPDIRGAVSFLLKKEGYAPEPCGSGREALAMLQSGKHFDLVIMDMVMPGLSGAETVRQMREFSSLPVLFLTARSADSDKIEAYGSGGDDYLSKPFSGVELLLRLRALLKHRSGEEGGEGTLYPDPAARCAVKNGKKIALTEREYSLLAFLYDHAGNVFSGAELYEQVWGEKYLSSSANTVMVHILNLRKKLEEDFTSPKHIRTVWGKGYCYVK